MWLLYSLLKWPLMHVVLHVEFAGWLVGDLTESLQVKFWISPIQVYKNINGVSTWKVAHNPLDPESYIHMSSET